MEMYASMAPKDYEEPEPDYPLSDSELTNGYSNSRRSPELRLFETDDLPLHSGDFTLQHSIMVRSRQLSEVAGLMDDTASNQPTLKRFSRYNQSMHSRPVSQICELGPGSSQQQQPHTYSKGGGRLKTGFFSGNWTLRGKKDQKMRPSVHNITVVQIGKPPSNSVAESPLLLPDGVKATFPVSPFQLHQRNHQYCYVNNSRLLDCIHSDDTTSLHNHRVLPSPGRENLRSDKFYVDSHNKSSVTEAPETVLPPFARASDNFTRFRTGGGASIAGISARERIIPIEFKALKGQAAGRRFPNCRISQEDSFDCTDDDIFQSSQLPDPKMRLKKSESCDDVGERGRSLHSQHPANNSSNNSSKVLEYGEIVEENGEDCHPSTAPAIAVDDDVTDDDDQHGRICRSDESRFGLMRRFGGVKSMGPIRRHWHRPIAEIFPSSNNTQTRSASKDSGLSSTAAVRSAKRNSNSSSSTDERCATPPPSLTHLLIDADSAYRTGTSESSPSSIASNNDRQQQSALRKSCPDLRISGIGSVLPKNMEAYRAQNRNRRAREKRQAALWKKKPIAEWSLDDVLLWLQHCKLDDVASVMIGYDISGVDVERWNDEILEQLGVANEKTRAKILHELQALKERQASPVDGMDDGGGTKNKNIKPRVPLFKLIRSSSYDKVVAVETPLTARDITVAEGRFGCLQVTKVNGANIPLREQDCFLEINEMSGQAFRSPLMFTKLVSEAAGEPIRLVVLRRRILPIGGTDGYCDDDNDTSSHGTFLEKTLRAIDQESSASSGVSSSELSSEVAPLVDDGKSQVLRL